jgi:hypothetical protein
MQKAKKNMRGGLVFAHNNVVFHNKVFNLGELIDMVTIRSWLWVTAKAPLQHLIYALVF